MGRFTQPDTLIPGAGNPQNFNKYSYVSNSPIRYTDPTGHREEATADTNTPPPTPPPIIPTPPPPTPRSNIPVEPDITPIPPDPDPENNADLQGRGDDEDDDGGNGGGDGGDVPGDADKDLEGDDSKTRTPDYINLDINISIFPVFGIDIPIIVDRYGDLYVGLGVFIGPEGAISIAGRISGSLTGGWTNNGPLEEKELAEYLTGGYLDLSGGFIGGLGGQTTPNKNYIKKNSFEVGLYFPGFGLSGGGQANITKIFNLPKLPGWDP